MTRTALPTGVYARKGRALCMCVRVCALAIHYYFTSNDFTTYQRLEGDTSRLVDTTAENYCRAVTR